VSTVVLLGNGVGVRVRSRGPGGERPRRESATLLCGRGGVGIPNSGRQPLPGFRRARERLARSDTGSSSWWRGPLPAETSGAGLGEAAPALPIPTDRRGAVRADVRRGQPVGGVRRSRCVPVSRAGDRLQNGGGSTPNKLVPVLGLPVLPIVASPIAVPPRRRGGLFVRRHPEGVLRRGAVRNWRSRRLPRRCRGARPATRLVPDRASGSTALLGARWPRRKARGALEHGGHGNRFGRTPCDADELPRSRPPHEQEDSSRPKSAARDALRRPAPRRAASRLPHPVGERHVPVRVCVASAPDRLLGPERSSPPTATWRRLSCVARRQACPEGGQWGWAVTRSCGPRISFLGMPSFARRVQPLIYPPDWPVAAGVQKALRCRASRIMLLCTTSSRGSALPARRRASAPLGAGRTVPGGDRRRSAFMGPRTPPVATTAALTVHGSRMCHEAYLAVDALSTSRIWRDARWTDSGHSALLVGFQLLRGAHPDRRTTAGSHWRPVACSSSSRRRSPAPVMRAPRGAARAVRSGLALGLWISRCRSFFILPVQVPRRIVSARRPRAAG